MTDTITCPREGCSLEAETEEEMVEQCTRDDCPFGEQSYGATLLRL